MLITLRRSLNLCTSTYTPGTLLVNGQLKWYSIEDPLSFDTTPDTPDFDALTNAPNKTCIPFGLYEMAFNFSERFQKQMPIVLNVPNRSGIRLHIANSADDVEGCVAIGKRYLSGRVISSKIAFDEFMTIFVPAVMREKVFLNVIPEFSV